MVGEPGSLRYGPDDEPAGRSGCGEESAGRSGRGHRAVPHTADIRVEAWAEGREQCLVEAVLGLVESFAETSGTHPTAVERVRVEQGSDDDLLAGLLDEVIFRLDVHGQVPVDVEVEAVGGGLDVRLAVVDVGSVAITGAAPKAVSFHELRLEQGPCGWTGEATVDV
ncbi:archease [Wenjunlia vitaminophila]|uniref:archease n=1 Tax=Wenjunlia vitaminophila TaxID=76728 RepID=UPI0003A0461E